MDVLFSLESAEQLLPKVKRLVEQVLAKGQQARQLLSVTPTPESYAHLNSLERDIQALFNELEALGCFYKDWNFEVGLVDFPAIINGQEVLLCWRSDEDRIEWYHGLEDGYAGRQRITKDMWVS